MNEILVYFDNNNQFYKIICLQIYLFEKMLNFVEYQIQLNDIDHHLKKHLRIYFIVFFFIKKKKTNYTYEDIENSER